MDNNTNTVVLNSFSRNRLEYIPIKKIGILPKKNLRGGKTWYNKSPKPEIIIVDNNGYLEKQYL